MACWSSLTACGASGRVTRPTSSCSTGSKAAATFLDFRRPATAPNRRLAATRTGACVAARGTASEGSMYIVSTLWKFGSPGQANEAIRRLRDSFGPLVRAQGGFRSWYLAASGVDEAVSLTL